MVNNIKTLSKLATNNTVRKKPVKSLASEKPISFSVVSEKKPEKTVQEVLSEAGNVAEEKENELNNASFKFDEDVVAKTTPYIIEGSETKENKEKTINNIDDLINSIKEIDDKFENISDSDFYPDREKSTLPDSLNLEKMEVPTIDEKVLGDEVRAEQTKQNELKKEQLKNDTENKIEALNKNKDSETILAQELRDDINEIYDDYDVSVENDALKRGLARSSVALLSLDNVESGRAKELSKIAVNLTKSLNEIEEEITDLQVEMESAISQLDIELTETINREIKSKIDELKKKQNEAIEFNNNIEKLEAEYQLKRTDSLDEQIKLDEDLKKRYRGVAEQKKQEEMMDIALSYFKSIDKKTALKQIINSPELASFLGNSFYDLYYYIMQG